MPGLDPGIHAVPHLNVCHRVKHSGDEARGEARLRREYAHYLPISLSQMRPLLRGEIWRNF
jgi:hypothetical protein